MRPRNDSAACGFLAAMRPIQSSRSFEAFGVVTTFTVEFYFSPNLSRSCLSSSSQRRAGCLFAGTNPFVNRLFLLFSPREFGIQQLARALLSSVVSFGKLFNDFLEAHFLILTHLRGYATSRRSVSPVGRKNIRNGHVHCLSLELPRRFDPLVPCVLFLT